MKMPNIFKPRPLKKEKNNSFTYSESASFSNYQRKVFLKENISETINKSVISKFSGFRYFKEE